MEGEGYNAGRLPCQKCYTMTCRAGERQQAAETADMLVLQGQLAGYRAALNAHRLTPDEKAETQRQLEVVEDHKRWLLGAKAAGDVWACLLCGMRGEFEHIVHHVHSDPPCARRLCAKAAGMLIAEPGVPFDPQGMHKYLTYMHPCE
mgnify:CR=1 FL=1